MPALGPSFARLWLGQTISYLGSQVTQVALPLTAVVVLQASTAQMGLLRAFASVTGLTTALFAGVLVDRFARRPILIGSDLAFALAAGAISAFCCSRSPAGRSGSLSQCSPSATSASASASRCTASTW